MKRRAGKQRSKKKILGMQGDIRTARSFDVIVRDSATQPVSVRIQRAAQRWPEQCGVEEASTTIQQLYTARKLAEATRDEIDKRITELRRHGRLTTGNWQSR